MMYAEQLNTLLHSLGQLTVSLDHYRDKADQYATLDKIEKLAKQHKAQLREGLLSSAGSVVMGQVYALTGAARDSRPVKWAEVCKEIKRDVPTHVYNHAVERWTTPNQYVTISITRKQPYLKQASR